MFKILEIDPSQSNVIINITGSTTSCDYDLLYINGNIAVEDLFPKCYCNVELPNTVCDKLKCASKTRDYTDVLQYYSVK